MTRIEFTVIGEAQPAGSKTSYPIVNPQTKQPVRGPTGRILTVTTHANPHTKPWMQAVAEAARGAYQGELLAGPIRLCLVFYRPRPKGHFGTGRNAARVRAAMPPYPATKPDLTKLTRAVEDALTKVIWRDDSQVCSVEAEKRWGEYAHATITIEEISHDSIPAPDVPSRAALGDALSGP